MDFWSEYIKGYVIGYAVQSIMNRIKASRSLRTIPRNAPEEIYVECRDLTAERKEGGADADIKI